MYTDFNMPAAPQAVVLSISAIQHFENIAPHKIIKLSVEAGGCAGYKYHWEIIENEDNLWIDDEVTGYDRFTFAVDAYSLEYLYGSTVDYIDDITGSHISISNPSANAQCGCGESIN